MITVIWKANPLLWLFRPNFPPDLCGAWQSPVSPSPPTPNTQNPIFPPTAPLPPQLPLYSSHPALQVSVKYPTHPSPLPRVNHQNPSGRLCTSQEIPLRFSDSAT